MKIMDSEKKELVKEAAKRLKGHEKRAYIAKISLDYFQGNARHTEREIGWGRECVQKGLKEKETGIKCIDGYKVTGRKRTEDKLSNLRIVRSLLLPKWDITIEPFDSADDEYNSWFDKGYALAESGQFEQAIESYDKALQIQSNDHAAWNNRSLALFNLGRFKEALESKRRVGRATAQRSSGTLNPPIFNYCER